MAMHRAAQQRLRLVGADEADIVVTLEQRHREVEDLLVSLDKGDARADDVLPRVHDLLTAELALWRDVVLPLSARLGERPLRLFAQRLLAARTALTRRVPDSAAAIPAPHLRASVTHLCEQWEEQHATEEQDLLLPLRRLAFALPSSPPEAEQEPRLEPSVRSALGA